MTATEPFTFGIALIARHSARDWDRVQALLDLTLASLQAQTDQDFKVVIAGHEPPRIGEDPRISFLAADWPAKQPGPRNADSGRKHHAISDHVLRSGGGLLMYVDADDWVDVCLVEAARRMVGPDCVGALIDHGVVIDFRSLRCAAVPHPRIFEGEYHRICGSGGIIRLRPKARDKNRRNPYLALRPHNCWADHAEAKGLALARLPMVGSYVVNHAQNHSELHGPHARWRLEMTQAVNREGGSLSPGLAARFGLTLDRIRAVSDGQPRTYKRHETARQGAAA
jgi:hypothetical protein